MVNFDCQVDRTKKPPRRLMKLVQLLMRVHLDKMNEGGNKCYWRWKAPSYRLRRYKRGEKNDNKQPPAIFFFLSSIPVLFLVRHLALLVMPPPSHSEPKSLKS